jgi:hypothetical protein
MSFGDFFDAGLDLLGGDSGGGAGGLLGGFLGGDSGEAIGEALGGGLGGYLSGGDAGDVLGGIGSSFFGDNAGGLLDNFAGSEGLGGMIGGLMEGDGIGAVGGLLAGTGAGDVLGGVLGASGLGNGVSQLLGGESSDWLGGLTDSLGGSGGIVGTIAPFISGTESGGFGGIAEQLGEAVGGDLGGVLTSVGAATSGGGNWFDTLETVIEGAGDSFGSSGGILGTVQELAGDGPAWLQTATSVAEQLGEGDFSEVAAAAIGGSSVLQNVADSTFGDAGLVGTALGELENWEELAEDGLGALGVDLPDVGGAVAALGLTPESIVDAASGAVGADSSVSQLGETLSSGDTEVAESIESEPIAELRDDLLGDESLVAASTPDSDPPVVPAPDPDVESPLDDGPDETDQFDVAFEADPTAPADSDPAPFVDDVPIFDEPVPMDDLTEAVEAADALEDSIEDLFEGLE